MGIQKIHINPMVPHYEISEENKNSMTISKGGKSSRNRSNNSLTTVKNSGSPHENPETETIELKAVRDADEKINTDHLPDYLKEAEKEGIHDAMKETVKEHRKNTFKFFGLINKSEKLVAKFKNIVPLLPGEVIIDTAKITFIKRPFFFSERIHSVSVKDVTDVFVETAPFFATLKIVDANFIENTIELNWLIKRDAEKARRIITGLMTAAREEVDLMNIEDDAIDEKLEEIGKARGVNTSVSKS